MKRIGWMVLGTVFAIAGLHGQAQAIPQLEMPGYRTITQDEIKTDLGYIASDKLAGADVAAAWEISWRSSGLRTGISRQGCDRSRKIAAGRRVTGRRLSWLSSGRIG